MSASPLDTAKHWRGYFETFEEVDAATEEEAKRLLKEKLIGILQADDGGFHSVWEVSPR